MKLRYTRAVEEAVLSYGVMVKAGDVADLPDHLARKALLTGEWEKAGDAKPTTEARGPDFQSQLESAQAQVTSLTGERDDLKKEVARLKRSIANLRKGK